MSFGVNPPWFESDRDVFNMCAMNYEYPDRTEQLQRLAREIRKLPNPNSVTGQNSLCQEICGCSIRELTDDEFEYLSHIVH